jgi:hypothetical protein
MQATIYQKFDRLVERLTQAFLNAQIPCIEQGQAVFYQIIPNDSQQSATYCYAPLFRAAGDAARNPVLISLENSCFFEYLQETSPKVLSSEQLSDQEKNLFSKEIKKFLIIPLAALYHPIGWLLIPSSNRDEEPDAWKAACKELSLLLEEAFFLEINSCIGANLPMLFSHRELASLFGNILDIWFIPYHYEFSDESETIKRHRQPYWKPEKNYAFSLTLKAKDLTFRVELLLLNPRNKDIIQEALLKKQAARLKGRLEDTFALFAEILFHKFEQFTMKRIERHLNEIQKLVTSVSNIAPESPPMPLDSHDFCFYEINNNWTIRFKGKTVTPPAKSNQGMHSIRLLLQQENVHIDPINLYDTLRELGVTYKTSSPLMDHDYKMAKITEYEDSIAKYYNKVKSPDTKKKDELEYWRQILEYGKALSKLDEKKNTKYLKMTSMAREKINLLSLLLGVDPNFQNPVSDILRENAIIPKNAKDSIASGINKVLEHLEIEQTQLHHYLDCTLVRTNNRGHDHKAFKFCPDLYDGSSSDLKNIFWVTEAP